MPFHLAPPGPAGSGPVAAARQAVERCAWTEARELARRALEGEETAEAFEVLGLASWWLSDTDTMFDARERAFRLYRGADDRLAAARIALWLHWDYRSFRGEAVVANGWLERARRLLQGLERTVEYGMLLVRDAEILLHTGLDAEEGRAVAARAAELGRALGDADLEFSGLALEGLGHVLAGEVGAGMRRLDEATAAVVAGEFTDLSAAGLACCHMIRACEMVRDYDRAGQWCDRLKEFCRRWEHLPLFAVCRTQYAGVLISRGAWAEAEAELAAASAELAAMRPGYLPRSIIRLGELRRRQGRLDEAADLLGQVSRDSLARLGLAALALDRGNPAECERLVRRILAGLAPGNHAERAAALELTVLAATLAGGPERATAELAELEALASGLVSEALRGSARLAAGVHAFGLGDRAGARRALEEAVLLFDRAGADYDALRARLYLAEALLAAGDLEGARADAQEALEGALVLGAGAEAARARQLIDGAAARPDQARPTSPDRLTARERQILDRIAKGLTNRQIAEALGLSEHTVHRHVANILTKLGLSSRAAAVAFAIGRPQG